MPVLLFSALLLIIILLIKYFVGSKWNIGLKLLTVFGIFIGLLAIGVNFLFDDAFAASTPVNVRVKNMTDKELKIYTIKFWDNSWSGTGNFVTYGSEVQPSQISDFWFENDGTYEFWLVAKDQKNQIEYLEVVTESGYEYTSKITPNQKVDATKAQIAKRLTLKKDKDNKNLQYAICANAILIGLLVLSLVPLKKREAKNIKR